MVVTCRAQSQESNVPPGYGVGWRSPPGLVESVGIHMAGMVGGWGLESDLHPWVMRHQHSQDTRNGCVKSPQDGRRCLDPWTEFQPFLIA